MADDAVLEALLAARRFAVNAISSAIDLPDFDVNEHVVIRMIDRALAAAPAVPGWTRDDEISALREQLKITTDKYMEAVARAPAVPEREALIEECARVAEGYNPAEPGTIMHGIVDALRLNIAAAIRALSDGKHGPQTTGEDDE